MTQNNVITTVKKDVFNKDFGNVNRMCRPDFVGRMIPQVRCWHRIDTITTKSFGTWSFKCQRIPALMEGCLAIYEGTVRKWGTKEQSHSGSGKTAEEFWTRFTTDSQCCSFSSGETWSYFSCPILPSLPSSAPSVAFADGNWVYYIGVRS